MPLFATSSAATWGWKYISVKDVVPQPIISSRARAVPAAMSSAVSRASTGKTLSNSQLCRGRSLPTPRSSVMAVWVWPLTRPGSTSLPDRSFSLSKSPAGRAVPT